MPEFFVTDWQTQLQVAEASDNKEIIYKFARKVFDHTARSKLTPTTLAQFHPDMILPERGMPRIARKRWGAGYQSLAGKTILVQGTGSGWDVVSWAKEHPAKIIGVDLFEFEAWPEIQDFTTRTYGCSVEFKVAPLHDLSFLSDASIDLAVSDAVFEHVQNLPDVMRESYRVLKPGGYLYAGYGPLWYCAGGDHFSGRGGLRNIFNHVLLDAEAYRKYFQEYKLDEENFQSGGRYVEIDLFSKLRSAQYLQYFKDAHFLIDGLILELSQAAFDFRSQFPDLFEKLKARNPDCQIDDFVIKSHLTRLRKPIS